MRERERERERLIQAESVCASVRVCVRVWERAFMQARDNNRDETQRGVAHLSPAGWDSRRTQMPHPASPSPARCN